MAPRSNTRKNVGLRKESQALSEYLKEAAPDDQRDFVAQQQLDLMIDICEACCKDRIQCVMRPLCDDRKQLQLLISIGAPESLYPQFCYTQYKNTLQRFWEKKSVIQKPIDAVISLKVFLELLVRKKEYQGTPLEKLRANQIETLFIERMGKYSKRIKTHHGSKNTLLSVDGVIYLLDFKKKLVTVNLTKKEIGSQDDLTDFLNLLSANYKLKYKLDVKMRGWIYLTIPLHEKIAGRIAGLLSKTRERGLQFDYIVESSMRGKTSLVIDVKTGEFTGSAPPTTYGGLRDLFQAINDLQDSLRSKESRKEKE